MCVNEDQLSLCALAKRHNHTELGWGGGGGGGGSDIMHIMGGGGGLH